MTKQARRAARQHTQARRFRRLLLEQFEPRLPLCAEHLQADDQSDPPIQLEALLETEPNNSPVLANVFTGPTDTLTGSLNSPTDVDHFVVALASGDTLRLRHTESDAEGGPGFNAAMSVLRGQTEIIANSPDAHNLAITAVTAGSYTLKLSAENVFGIVTGDYSVEAAVEAFSGVTESESNETQAAATPLSGQANFRGSLSSEADLDFFSFSVTAGQSVVLKLADKPLANPALRLYSPSGALLAVDRSGLGVQSTNLPAGKYAFAIQADNLGGSVSGAYVGQLLISNAPLLAAESGHGFESATVLDLGPQVISSVYLSPDASFTTRGLVGSYINQNLRGVSAQTDWRSTQAIAGTRLDPSVHFPQNDWGNRSTLNLTGGTDANWDNFSVQWDGFLRVVTAGTTLATATDDGSRLWIDLNGDGAFATSGSELINNNWSRGQANTIGPSSVALAPGDYRVRLQYESTTGDNNAYLLWTDAAHSGGGAVRNHRRDVLGSLASLNDVDVFAVHLTGTGMYEFRLEATAGATSAQNRLLTIYNEYGQPLEYSTSGRLATDRYQVRPEITGRHFITVQATGDTGLGAYQLFARVTREFPTYRDVPLFYEDFVGATTHLSYGPGEPLVNQQAIPHVIGMSEAMYDIYQIDVTLTQPAAGIEHVNFGMGEYGDIGAAGWGGGNYGARRPSGGSVVDNPGSNWTAINSTLGPVGTMNHELGHAVGLPHTRHPLAFMSYDRNYTYIPVGSHNRMANDSRVSMPKVQNQRSYLDWALESGRIALEEESNDNLALAQWLDPYISEMSLDADARNDQAVIAGAIATPADVDIFRFRANANETWSIDIDSAEFQYALNAKVEILDASASVVTTSRSGLDRDSGLSSFDPYLVQQFTIAGDYYIRVTPEVGTTGAYRLKVTPARAFDQTPPRVVGAWPEHGAAVNGTRQLNFWFNDQLDPAKLTSANIVVTGAQSGVRDGAFAFNPISSALTWVASTTLPADTYTVRLKSGAAGLTDLRGNPLDGETDTAFNWPDVSGNGAAGGDFELQFTVTQPDTTPAAVNRASFFRHNHGRVTFEVVFTDELNLLDVYNKTFTLRGAGPDHLLATADDTFAPVDVMYDEIGNMSSRTLRVYSRGVLDPDAYRLEASLVDAAGFPINLSQTFTIVAAVPATALLTTPTGTVSGLVGSYVNQSLRSSATQADWRATQTIAGTRIDPLVNFYTNGFGSRAAVGITGGTDDSWQNFSVQWDGAIVIPENGVRLFTRTDDGSRLWIDVNNDGVFAASGAEFVNNGWGQSQGVTNSAASVALNAGVYRIRMQYEGGTGGNRAYLAWDYKAAPTLIDGLAASAQVVEVRPQPHAATTIVPATIDVTFSQSIATASLTPATFKVRYSPDPTFFDENDSFLTGNVTYSASSRKASFLPTSRLRGGYYLIELEGNAGGITNLAGQLLDGEYHDANIAGNNASFGWNKAPSGDGQPGGDYRAMFIIDPSLTPPSISEIEEQLVAEDGSLQVPFALSDQDSSLDLLQVTVTSDNPSVLPPGSLAVSGEAGNRFLDITPAPNKFGNASLVLTVTDGSYTTQSTFTLRVTPVNDPPAIGNISGKTVAEDGWIIVDVTISDIDTLMADLTVAAASAQTALLPASSFELTGTGVYRGLRIQPAADAFGDGEVAVTVQDAAGATTSVTFALTVAPVNDRPSIQLIQDRSLWEDWLTAFPIEITDIDSPRAGLTVSATSDNAGLLSAGALSLTDTGIIITPAPNQTGVATITLFASDGSLDATHSFRLTVKPVNDPPSASDRTLYVTLLESYTFSIGDFGFSDGIDQPSNALLAVQIKSAPLNGTLTLDGLPIAIGQSIPSTDLVAKKVIYATASATASFTDTLQFAVKDDGGTANGGVDEDQVPHTLTLRVTPRNHAPTFTKGTNPSANDYDGPQTLLGWATGISAGHATEGSQQLQFKIRGNTNPGLFRELPRISEAGDLTFAPLPNAFGSASILVQLHDDGGTASGGADTSGIQIFAIAIEKPRRWHNTLRALDVTGPGDKPDNAVVPGDALAIVNYINAFGAGPVPTSAAAGPPFLDTAGGPGDRGDNFVSAGDALAIINYINAFGSGLPGPEGESATAFSSRPSEPPAASSDLLALLAQDVALQPKRRR